VGNIGKYFGDPDEQKATVQPNMKSLPLSSLYSSQAHEHQDGANSNRRE
jgi:hypothetical protein